MKTSTLISVGDPLPSPAEIEECFDQLYEDLGLLFSIAGGRHIRHDIEFSAHCGALASFHGQSARTYLSCFGENMLRCRGFMAENYDVAVRSLLFGEPEMPQELFGRRQRMIAELHASNHLITEVYSSCQRELFEQFAREIPLMRLEFGEGHWYSSRGYLTSDAFRDEKTVKVFKSFAHRIIGWLEKNGGQGAAAAVLSAIQRDYGDSPYFEAVFNLSTIWHPGNAHRRQLYS